jgi:hypothetical protein
VEPEFTAEEESESPEEELVEPEFTAEEESESPEEELVEPEFTAEEESESPEEELVEPEFTAEEESELYVLTDTDMSAKERLVLSETGMLLDQQSFTDSKSEPTSTSELKLVEQKLTDTKLDSFESDTQSFLKEFNRERSEPLKFKSRDKN